MSSTAFTYEKSLLYTIKYKYLFRMDKDQFSQWGLEAMRTKEKPGQNQHNHDYYLFEGLWFIVIGGSLNLLNSHNFFKSLNVCVTINELMQIGLNFERLFTFLI